MRVGNFSISWPRRFIPIVLLVCLYLTIPDGDVCAFSTQINYSVLDLGSGRWQYDYEISNISLEEDIEEFTIWFDYGLYSSLSVSTQLPLSNDWDEIVWQPEPVIGDSGGYDALALGLGIGQGESISGFSVTFDWLGIGAPGSQYYEIIDPVTFGTIESGYTVPEPTTCLLLLAGGLLLRRKKKQ